jgi:hypothetical protein
MISIRLYGVFARPGKRSRKAELLLCPGESPYTTRLVVRRKGSSVHLIEVNRDELAQALDLVPTDSEPA